MLCDAIVLLFLFPSFISIGRMLVQVYPAFVSCWYVFFLTIVCLFVLHDVSNKFDLIWFESPIHHHNMMARLFYY